MNYFEFYDLPVSFQVDENLLRARFYEKSRAYHPDFHTLASHEQQEAVLEKSTINNQAFKTLKDFDERLKYILELFGKIKNEGENKVPQDFLMDMMEINENLMELEMDPSVAARKTLLDEISSIEKNAHQEVQSFTEKDLTTLTEEEWTAICDYYFKRRYLKRLQENIDKITDDL